MIRNTNWVVPRELDRRSALVKIHDEFDPDESWLQYYSELPQDFWVWLFI